VQGCDESGSFEGRVCDLLCFESQDNVDKPGLNDVQVVPDRVEIRIALLKNLVDFIQEEVRTEDEESRNDYYLSEPGLRRVLINLTAEGI
jgi:hypothetical protein